MKKFWINVSTEHKLTYFLVPKAASTSIRHAIGRGDTAYNANLKALRQYSQFLTISSIRNPWDRLVSVFANARDDFGKRPVAMGHLLSEIGLGARCTFEEFAQKVCTLSDIKSNIHYRSQHTFFPSGIDLLIQFENLQKDWNKLLKLRPELPKLQKLESHEHDHYLKYYSDELLRLVADRYETDIALFGYEIP